MPVVALVCEGAGITIIPKYENNSDDSLALGLVPSKITSANRCRFSTMLATLTLIDVLKVPVSALAGSVGYEAWQLGIITGRVEGFATRS
jgi:hypothetical protein